MTGSFLALLGLTQGLRDPSVSSFHGTWLGTQVREPFMSSPGQRIKSLQHLSILYMPLLSYISYFNFLLPNILTCKGFVNEALKLSLMDIEPLKKERYGELTKLMAVGDRPAPQGTETQAGLGLGSVGRRE